MMDWIFLLAIPLYFILDRFLWSAACLLSFMAFNAARGVLLETAALSTVSILRMAGVFAVVHIVLGIPLTHPIFFVLSVLDFHHGVNTAIKRVANDVDEDELQSVFRFSRGILCGQVALVVLMAAVVWRAAF